jgi:glycopeptide antibiotics resistance protein
LLYLIVKAGLSGIIIAIVSEVARKAPGFGALIASLPLISILGMIWLWRDTNDPVRLADHAQATFWFVLPSLPMFLLVPMLLKRGVAFWPALAAGCLLTILLYVLTTWVLARAGVRL